MDPNLNRARDLAEDEIILGKMGYRQELSRRMGGFSNFAISFSIICILAGCITSFPSGFCTVGGASIGLGWPLVCLFSMIVAATMAHIASAFPTAGGLYHWASILGGRGLGWATAWFNMAGLITVAAAVNAGAYDFMAAAFNFPTFGHPQAVRILGIAFITVSHAVFNHKGIRLTTLLTDFSGYLILLVSLALTAALLWNSPHYEFARLTTFSNYSGIPADDPVIPSSKSLGWLFALGFLLPAYTLTGFDASAHTSEETVGAGRNVPRGIVRSVWISSLFGWIMLCAIVLAIPNMDAAAAQGNNAFPWIMKSVLPSSLSLLLLVGISVAQYFCGLACLTSGSRMAFAFARDGGLPGSKYLRRVSPTARTPSVAIWFVAILAVSFIIFLPYTAIAAVCAVFLYISYVLPTAAGFYAWGRSWTEPGPWSIGAWYRPLAVLAMVGCGGLIVIGMQPPNQQAAWIVGGMLVAMVIVWFGFERKRFQGPPLPARRSSPAA